MIDFLQKKRRYTWINMDYEQCLALFKVAAPKQGIIIKLVTLIIRFKEERSNFLELFL
jgi:hypothetical protein